MAYTREDLRQYILSRFLPGENPANLRDDTPLRGSGIIDSMGVLLIVRFLEERLGSEINPHEMRAQDFATIDAISSFVERRSALVT